MAGGMWGANVEQLRGLGQTLQQKADEIRTTMQNLNSQIQGVPWEGPDAQQFKGSDWPVATPNPFAGIAAAVTGLTADGEVWIPNQNISVEQALRAYTIAAAWTEGRERERGTIETGKLADVVILSQDIFTCPKERIIDTTVTHTIVGGKVVWEATK